jgi:hypothetical protein
VDWEIKMFQEDVFLKGHFRKVEDLGPILGSHVQAQVKVIKALIR